MTADKHPPKDPNRAAKSALDTVLGRMERRITQRQKRKPKD